MSLPAWEEVLPHLPDEFGAAFNGIALDAHERYRAEAFQAASRILVEVIGCGQTAISEVVSQLEDLHLAARHKEALLQLSASLGSAVYVLGNMERYATDYLALSWPPAEAGCSSEVATQSAELSSSVATGEGGQ